LLKQGYTKSAEAFASEAKVDFEAYLKTTSTPASLLKDILERKWTSIARLKKQVMELEKQCKQQKETIDQNAIDIQNMEKGIIKPGAKEDKVVLSGDILDDEN
jgi:hypothetical protein